VLSGQRNPLHATGLGKALLSGLGPAERRTLLPQLQSFTPHTITTHELLDEALERTAALGYATEVQELALGRACVAAPIRGRGGAVVAALSVSGPLSAIDLPSNEARLVRAVIEAADSISIGLGYVGPVHVTDQAATSIA
jgi:DNA-binding IclR family transcriptional regulator